MIHMYGDIEVEIQDEPTYSTNSTDNPRQYNNEYWRVKAESHYSAAHGVSTLEHGLPISSAIVLGQGGATGIHKDSCSYDGSSIYVAAGDSVYSLSLPMLNLNWARQVDKATCFGVFWLEHLDYLLTWGELSIRSYSVDGKELWSATGSDIFTEGLELKNQKAMITDYNGHVHKVDLVSGEISREST